MVLILCLLLPLKAHAVSILKPKYYISVCALFRNEARFLREWIEYHRMMGVDHFYLFNQSSDDDYFLILEPYIRAGVVELFDWPQEAEVVAYNRLLKERGRETFWLALIGTNEFIVPLQTPNLHTFLRGYEKHAGLSINWQLYGTSNVYRLLENQLLLETLTQRAPADHPDNHTFKTIIQPTKIKEVKEPNLYKYHRHNHPVDENKERLSKNKTQSPRISVEKIRINRYAYRDEDFFYSETCHHHSGKLLPTIDPSYNAIEDPLMLKFIPALKERLNFISF